jgi:hypothetical protein
MIKSGDQVSVRIMEWRWLIWGGKEDQSAEVEPDDDGGEADMEGVTIVCIR